MQVLLKCTDGNQFSWGHHVIILSIKKSVLFFSLLPVVVDESFNGPQIRSSSQENTQKLRIEIRNTGIISMKWRSTPQSHCPSFCLLYNFPESKGSPEWARRISRFINERVLGIRHIQGSEEWWTLTQYPNDDRCNLRCLPSSKYK